MVFGPGPCLVPQCRGSHRAQLPHGNHMGKILGNQREGEGDKRCAEMRRKIRVIQQSKENMERRGKERIRGLSAASEVSCMCMSLLQLFSELLIDELPVLRRAVPASSYTVTCLPLHTVTESYEDDKTHPVNMAHIYIITCLYAGKALDADL